MATLTALQQLQKLDAEHETARMKIKNDALSELQSQRDALVSQLKGVDSQIEEITGKKARGRKAGGGAPKAGLPDVPTEKALKDLLKGAEGKKLSRKGFTAAGFNLKSALVMAEANKETFGFKQNRAQGEVWLK